MLKLFSGFFLSFCLLATGQIQIAGESRDQSRQFGEIITRTGMKLQEVARRRPFRLRGMNDSLDAVARAARLMASGGNRQQVDELLQESIRAYPENSFAYLLRAVLHNSQGRNRTAYEWFESFLTHSRTYGQLEKKFISWNDFHKLRRIVYDMLRAEGIDFQGREEEIQVRIPFDSLMQYLHDPLPADKFWNTFFIITVILGLFFLVFSGLTGVDFSGFGMRTVVYLYFSIWLAYGIWFWDLAFGLPGALTRLELVPVILVTVTVLRLLQGVHHWWQERNRPIKQGYRRCPHCGHIMEFLMLECPQCRKRSSPPEKNG